MTQSLRRLVLPWIVWPQGQLEVDVSCHSARLPGWSSQEETVGVWKSPRRSWVLTWLKNPRRSWVLTWLCRHPCGLQTAALNHRKNNKATYPKFRQSLGKKLRRATISRDLDGDDNDDADDAEDDDDDIDDDDDDDDGQFFRNLPPSPPSFFSLLLRNLSFETGPYKP